MKQYKEYIDEISEDELYKALLGYGMFAENLPPFLTSKWFYDFCQSSHTQFTKKPQQYVYYENIRNINIPRPLGIPTPMSYQILCKCLKDNWQNLQGHFKATTGNQKYKVSRIHIRKLRNSNSVFEMNYSNWSLDPNPDEDLLIDKYYIVNADISKCFPSIYTHSLPWALVGKSVAKTNKNKGWYNDLDKYTRNMKSGETHGLIIGPHTSNLLSEIILCSVDKALIDKGWEYIRNIDDYTCYVRTEQEARQFLIDLQAELREFDLSLNHKKTLIMPLPSASVEHWIRKINSVSIITSYGKVDYKNCRAYLDYAIELVRKEGENSAILKYAIKVLSGRELTNNAKTYMKKTILHLSLIYPYLIPMLDKYIFSFCEVSPHEIEEISNKIYDYGMNNRIFESSSYALFFAVKYGFKIKGVSSARLISEKDCILLLLGYKYFSAISDKASIKELKDYAKILSKEDDDLNRNWLFVYEILPQSFLKGDWKVLKKAKVSFVKNIW